MTETMIQQDIPLELSFSFARRNQVVVEGLSEQGDRLMLACTADTPLHAILECQRLSGKTANITRLESDAFDQLLNDRYANRGSETMQAVEGIGDDLDLGSIADAVSNTEDLLEQEDDAPIIRLINAILSEAIKEQASDIHIETYERQLLVRFRVDGVLREVLNPRRALAPLLISRIKVMAKLDIAEKRVPQDGRIPLRVAGREVDVRVSTLPSTHGERVVMRLLDKQSSKLDLAQLGLAQDDLTRLRTLISRPHGIILITGPTGSGKTTTLYGSLGELNDQTRNILTVEDPIEYSIPGIGQTQVNTKVEMTFAKGLRAILRQDPDVVMIGEIRDKETVEIAVQASLTGHLVLSTIHTNSAVGAITRLQDMGIEPFLLSSSLVGVLAQRLVRTLCPTCKEGKPATAIECNHLGADPQSPPTIYHPVGCDECNQSGYRGRLGLYELVMVDDQMRQLIHDNAGELKMNESARRQTPSITQDGYNKVLAGLTTLEEVLRVARSQ